MRLLRLCTNYQGFLDRFYFDNPGLRSAGYNEQYTRLAAECFGWADYWTHALAPFGYEVWEPVGNAEHMQKKWALERGVKYADETWVHDIAAAQAKAFRPDVLFINDYHVYTAEFISHLREVCPSIRLVLGWCGAAYPRLENIKAYDIVLSNIPHLVTIFKNQGLSARYLPHAFEPRILNRLKKDAGTVADFSFVGSVFKYEGLHNEREKILAELAEKTKIQIWTDVKYPTRKDALRHRISRLMLHRLSPVGSILGLMSPSSKAGRVKEIIEFDPVSAGYLDPRIRRRALPPVYGVGMYQQLSDSRVTLNTHIDLSRNEASNLRLFEATGVGACLVTERQPNLPDLFEPDEEVATYSSVEELIQKVNYLLEHEAVRGQIAGAGQKRTLRCHTIAHRAAHVNTIIRDYLKAV
jgi:spore maturation protein CgeB